MKKLRINESVLHNILMEAIHDELDYSQDREFAIWAMDNGYGKLSQYTQEQLEVLYDTYKKS